MLRYQVIFDGTDDGNKHIISPMMSGFKSEEAAVKYCDSLMREPQWKHDLEVHIVSDRLRGYTVGYQLEHFDRLFADWSDYEKDLAHKILTGQFVKKCDYAESSLEKKIADAKAQQGTNKENDFSGRDYEIE